MNIEQNLNIDTIPSGWSIQRVKEIACWQTGFTPDTKKPEYYDGHDEWITIGDLDGKIVKSSKNKIDGSFFPKNWLTPANSLLFSFKLSIGQVAFNEKEVYTNEAICSFSPKSKINLKYFYYAAPYFIVKNANKNIYGADLLNQELIANALLMVPPKEQQEKIANYLDIETSKIDRKISILEQKHEKLEEYKQSVIFEAVTKGLDNNVPMKDSGIDWIGETPAHWEIKRVKDVSKIKKGKAVETFLEQSEEMLPCIDTNFLRGRDNIVFCKNGTKISSEKVLILWDGANAGELFFNEDVGYLGSTFGVFNTKLNNQFWFYYLKGIEQYSRDNLTGMGIPHVDGNVLKQTIALIPSDEEQTQIVNHLDIESSKIDKKKEIIKKKIELLKEYKQTIIYEAVTGKINIL